MGANPGVVSVGSHGGIVLGSFTAASAVVAAPLAGYGGIWTSDTGVGMADANAYTKWSFMPIVVPVNGVFGTVTSFGISVYGTNDVNAWSQYQLWATQNNSRLNGLTPTLIPASNWFLLDAPSAQAGTGGVANPLTALGTSLSYSNPLVAVRCVLTTAMVGTATIAISAFAAP